MEYGVCEAGSLHSYKYAVIFGFCGGGWVFCKHKKRETWETAGGHIEPGETPLAAAKRELFEETGASDFEIEPICDYWACDDPNGTIGTKGANAAVFFAKIKTIGELPESEMEKVGFFEGLPESLTYPGMTANLFPYAQAAMERAR